MKESLGEEEVREASRGRRQREEERKRKRRNEVTKCLGLTRGVARGTSKVQKCPSLD